MYMHLSELWKPPGRPVHACYRETAHLQEVACRGVYSGLPGLVTVLWGLYNCIGPYLLLHYTYLGRRRSLSAASAAAMGSAVGLAVLAVALLVAFTPTTHDLVQVLPQCRLALPTPPRVQQLSLLMAAMGSAKAPMSRPLQPCMKSSRLQRAAPQAGAQPACSHPKQLCLPRCWTAPTTSMRRSARASCRPTIVCPGEATLLWQTWLPTASLSLAAGTMLEVRPRPSI